MHWQTGAVLVLKLRQWEAKSLILLNLSKLLIFNTTPYAETEPFCIIPSVSLYAEKDKQAGKVYFYLGALQTTNFTQYSIFISVTGHIIHHDDSTTDRSEGSERNRDEMSTKRLWLETYGSPLAVPGKPLEFNVFVKRTVGTYMHISKFKVVKPHISNTNTGFINTHQIVKKFTRSSFLLSAIPKFV